MFSKFLKKIIDKFGNFNLLKKTIINGIKICTLDSLLKSKKILVVFFLLGGIALYIDCFKTDNSKKANTAGPAQIDTFIPEGYVLVPIEIQNFDSLDALLGDFALVDVFATHNHNKSKKVLENVKLIRAPLNPKQFALLVSEELASEVMKVDPPYFVTIQNTNAKSNPHGKKQTKSKIIYEDQT